MASTILPVAELRQLLTAVSDHGAQHLLEVEADLNQTTFLLNGAIEKLSDSFMAIHETVTAQQQEIDVLLSSADVPDTDRQSILALREKISVEVNAAVTGLQFQDMTSQLIARVIKRVSGLRESLAELATHGEGMAPEHEHEEIVRLLEEMSASLNLRNDALKGGLIKSVGQQDMSSGDIELF
ncbi:MAG: chemotaxis protein [Methylophilaceae bacterium]|nr:MAG: chemotaxis protein [Methylophilaceae bacterium]